LFPCEVVTKTEYVKGDPVSDTITNIEPVGTEMPEVVTFPVKTDTVYIDNIQYVTHKVDTLAIIRGYELKRFYSKTLFSNQYGKLGASFSTQYNRVSDLKYDFTPVTIVRTVEKERLWTPFVSASYNSIKQASIGGGLFYHDTGVQIRYSTGFNANGLDVGLLYKF
jgi:hypothetical protein